MYELPPEEKAAPWRSFDMQLRAFKSIIRCNFFNSTIQHVLKTSNVLFTGLKHPLFTD